MDAAGMDYSAASGGVVIACWVNHRYYSVTLSTQPHPGAVTTGFATQRPSAPGQCPVPSPSIRRFARNDEMDTLTLLLAAALASAIMTATMYVLHRASPRETCLLDWSWAGVLFLATNCVAVAAAFYQVPFWVAPAIGNALYISGHGAMLIGVRRHLGRRPGWALLLILFVLVFAAHWPTFVQTSITYRLMLFYPIIMALNLGVVLLLWRAPASDM